MTDAITQLAFSMHENRGVYALLLGSGLSRSAAIPTGWEITLDLVRRVALADGVEEQEDWAEWHRQRYGQEPEYSALLARLSASPAERQAILQNYIEPSEEERESGLKTPTPAHRAIARMVEAGIVRVLVTTNFDRLLEMALRERGIEPTVVASADALAGAPPLTHCSCYVLKLHGDYKDARILNTEQELSAYPEGFDRLLDRIFDEHGLIVCGWSGEWDPALRSAILRAPGRRYGAFWANRGEPLERARELIAHRDARRLDIQDANAFFTGLWERLETLRSTGARNPQSVDLQVATAKRYLGRPEERIRLDALLEEEVSRAHALLSSSDLGAAKAWSPDEFRRQVGAYEASTETLASMLGAVGRWGQETDDRLARDVVRDLYRWKQQVHGGLVVLVGLRAYPAALAFTAYGLGLVRARRWKPLHDLLVMPLARDYGETRLAVETLFLDAMDDLGNDAWKLLPDVPNHKTALSDHLFGLFERWRCRFLGLTPDFERDFELFEALAGVAHAEQRELPILQAALADARQRSVFVPVGRAAWRRSALETLRHELEGSLQAELLGAGFGRGDREHFDAAFANLTAMGHHARFW